MRWRASFCEFFREPDPQLGFLWGGLTMGMLLSVPLMLAGVAFIAAALQPSAAASLSSMSDATPLEAEIRRRIALAGPMPVRAIHGAVPHAIRSTATT